MYIEYTMDQLTLPMELQEDIPDNHLVRVINDDVNRLPMKIQGTHTRFGRQLLARSTTGPTWLRKTAGFARRVSD
ncbi:hypothetical protein [Paenibacillus abyssi]|uniref:Uncharacterized protein n=1 Tax=Paenibacillus abyssi TaxID=1340531 RepID=A0A917FYU7_9BACL|nr:hypothetical protein [Paenibacillus abyssi]GGG14616.1 hypothetical protein GCM10010916_34410 [Paenibacillus abyssi]